jgi:hypothetical protein
MNPYVMALVASILAALFSGLLTYYFSTRNNKSMVYDILEKELEKCMEIHNNEKHQRDNEVNNAVRHMELRQNTMNMKLTFLTTLMSKIAEKLQITITPEMFPSDGDENG